MTIFYEVRERRYGNGQEWEVIHFSTEDRELAFAELDAYLTDYDYAQRSDMRVVEVEMEIPDGHV